MGASNLHLVSTIPPSVNHYLSYRVIYKSGRPMAMSYKTLEASKYQKDFMDYVVNEVKKQGWQTDTDTKRHFYVDCVFYFDRIDRDANNYFKCMLDAITDTKLIWQDDNVVCERVNRIYYDSVNPRVEIDIHYTDYIGIFDNTGEYEEFIARCKKCRRYDNNCSILKKAIEGKSQIEIKDKTCLKFGYKRKGK